MAAAQEGDRRAYAGLLKQSAVLLRRAITARCPYLQPGDVEDRVQDILLSVHEARATYDPARPFVPWLMAIARNRLADEARRYGRRAAYEVVCEEPPETFSGHEANKDAQMVVDAMALQDASLPFVALVILVMSPRPDLAAKLGEARFLIEQGAAFATAVTAAIAAFHLVIPGANRRMAFLPVVPFAVWVTTLGVGCIADWVRHGLDGLRITPDLACFPNIALVGSLPAIVIILMLRRGAPLAPYATMVLGGLAAAALGSFGLRFFHPQDAGIMVLLWQFGSVIALSLIAGGLGQFFLRWQHRRLAVH